MKRLVSIGSIVVRLEDGPHPIEIHRAGIDENWNEALSANPHLFNDPFFLTVSDRRNSDGFAAVYRQTDFAAFLYWRKTPHLRKQYSHIFSNALITGNDNKIICGRMAKHTNSAGKIYPPAGSISLDDIREGQVDFYGNMLREVFEETGLMLDTNASAANWLLYQDQGVIALLKKFQMEQSSSALIEEIESNLPSVLEREHDAFFAVGPGEILENMPDHIIALQMQRLQWNI